MVKPTVCLPLETFFQLLVALEGTGHSKKFATVPVELPKEAVAHMYQFIKRENKELAEQLDFSLQNKTESAYAKTTYEQAEELTAAYSLSPKGLQATFDANQPEAVVDVIRRDAPFEQVSHSRRSRSRKAPSVGLQNQPSPYPVQAEGDQMRQPNYISPEILPLTEEAEEIPSHKAKGHSELGIELRNNNSTDSCLSDVVLRKIGAYPAKGQLNTLICNSGKENEQIADDTGEGSTFQVQTAYKYFIPEANSIHSNNKQDHTKEQIGIQETAVCPRPTKSAPDQQRRSKGPITVLNSEAYPGLKEKSLPDQRPKRSQPKSNESPECTEWIPQAVLWMSELPSDLFDPDGPLRKTGWTEHEISELEQTWRTTKEVRNELVHGVPKELEVYPKDHKKMIRELETYGGCISGEKDKQNLIILYNFLRNFLQKDYVKINDIPVALATHKVPTATGPTNSRAEALKDTNTSSSQKQKRQRPSQGTVGRVPQNRDTGGRGHRNTNHACSSGDGGYNTKTVDCRKQTFNQNPSNSFPGKDDYCTPDSQRQREMQGT